VVAISALISIGLELGDPFLYTGSGELQINQQPARLFDLHYIFFLASRASLAFDVDDLVRVNIRSPKISMPLVDDPELTVCSHENFFTLVIKVGAFIHVFEIVQRVVPNSKHLPT
jgi:hypothetical protein